MRGGLGQPIERYMLRSVKQAKKEHKLIVRNIKCIIYVSERKSMQLSLIYETADVKVEIYDYVSYAQMYGVSNRATIHKMEKKLAEFLKLYERTKHAFNREKHCMS